MQLLRIKWERSEAEIFFKEKACSSIPDIEEAHG